MLYGNTRLKRSIAFRTPMQVGQQWRHVRSPPSPAAISREWVNRTRSVFSRRRLHPATRRTCLWATVEKVSCTA